MSVKADINIPWNISQWHILSRLVRGEQVFQTFFRKAVSAVKLNLRLG